MLLLLTKHPSLSLQVHERAPSDEQARLPHKDIGAWLCSLFIFPYPLGDWYDLRMQTALDALACTRMHAIIKGGIQCGHGSADQIILISLPYWKAA